MNSVTVFSWQLMKELRVQCPTWQSQAGRVLLGELGSMAESLRERGCWGEGPAETRKRGAQQRGLMKDGCPYRDPVPSHSAPMRSVVALKQFKSSISFY